MATEACGLFLEADLHPLLLYREVRQNCVDFRSELVPVDRVDSRSRYFLKGHAFRRAVKAAREWGL